MMQMNSVKWSLPLFFSALFSTFFSCNRGPSDDNYEAFFGGEVLNPKTRYIILSKGDKIIDSIKLDANNRFFAQFDSLAPGLYTFTHEPEYQYVYFDKNDSLLVLINSKDFDESIVFTGRGEQKNNFLMEMFLRNERDRDSMFNLFDYEVTKFLPTAEKTYRTNVAYYQTKKEEIQWSDEFDQYARAAVDFPYYSKKEMYPVIHKIRTGRDIMSNLPASYYEFRKGVDFNNEKLAYFSPYVKYISHMLNNVAAMKHRHDSGDENTIALKANTSKMQIADTLLKNNCIKNRILNSIAYNYLMEDQNMSNNQQFFEAYYKYSTDRNQENEVRKIATAIQNLRVGGRLPEVQLITAENEQISSNELNTPTVIFFWTSQANTHLIEAHKKIHEYKKKYPRYTFVGVNLDDDQDKWKSFLERLSTDGIVEVRCADFEQIRTRWAITKIHRTIVVNPDGTIRNGFTNIFDKDFEKSLH